MTRVDLIRHGEPVGGRRYRGQIDDPLSERGWRQMEEALTGEIQWQAVVTSPLCRCRDFAARYAETHALALHVEPRFMEIGFGAWEGRGHEEIRQQDPHGIANFLRDPVRFRPPDAEPLDRFAARVSAAWQALLTAFAGRHVLVVAHAGVIRAVTAEVLGMPPAHMFRLQVDNAAVSRIRITTEGLPRLLLHNGGSASSWPC